MYVNIILSRFFIGVLCGLTLIGLHHTVHADKVDNLYEATVPVASQNRDERNEAIRKAFAEVLVRISGRSDIAESTDYPGIAEAIERATRYAQQFRFYRANPPPKDPDAPKLVLWVRFDEQAVSRVLRENLLPVWGDTRPATLVWLVVDNRGRRELIGNDPENPVHRVLQQRATNRGLPLRFPLLDLTDRSNLRVSDVWGNFESTIINASQRYQTEAILVGRVFQGYGGHWSARWSLYSDGRRQDWSLSASKFEEVLAPGIDKTAESLALRYAQTGTVDGGQVLVQVKQIRNLADYNRVVKYLGSLSHVSAVQPYHIELEGATFRLTTSGGRLGIARAVALGDVLTTEARSTSIPVTGIPDTNNPATGADGAAENQQQQFSTVVPDLVYRLVP